MVDLIAAAAGVSPDAVKVSLLSGARAIEERVPGAVVAFDISPN